MTQAKAATESKNTETGETKINGHKKPGRVDFLTLGHVTFKLPDLLKMIFDRKLFYNARNNKGAPLLNFLEHIVRHQAGVQGSFAADAVVDRFTCDLWKLVQKDGLTMTYGVDVRGNSRADNIESTQSVVFAVQAWWIAA